MKKTLSLAALCIAIFCISACHKDSNPGTRNPDPIKIDLSTKVSSKIEGFVTDPTGKAVPFAQVFAGTRQVNTDEFGYFSIPSVSLPEAAGLIKVTAVGYITGLKTIVPQKDKTSFLRIQLQTNTDIGTIDAATGGEVTSTEGLKIILPANGVVTAAGGQTYTGEIHVRTKSLRGSDNDAQSAFPGDGRGVDSAGYLKALKSYGAAAIELTSAGGQALQIAPGKTASIFIPIDESMVASAPASIYLWSFNDTTGLWRQEGRATKKGNQYCGNTSHFSFWDGAEAIPLVTVKAKILDASAHPLAHVPVRIGIAGLPSNSGNDRFGFTDEDGNVSAAVFANSQFVLEVMTTCSVTAYSHTFSTGATDMDLGQLSGNLGQSLVTISGTVNSCNNQPVADGYVQTYDHGFYNRIPVTNGTFSFTGLACTNQEVSIVAIDNTTHQQGTPKTLTLQAGVNSLGTLTACGTSTMGSISYVLDGVTTTIDEPADTIGAYFLPQPSGTEVGDWTQILVLSKSPNTDQQMAFQFSGGKAIGDGHTLTDVYCNKFSSKHGYWVQPVKLTITEYGEIGGFVAGSFSNQLLESDNSAVHTFSINFRIRRYN